MKQFDLSGYNLQSRIYWGVVLFISAAVLGLTIFESFSFSILQLSVLTVALVISVLISIHPFKIPGTPHAKFPVREIIAFWGTIYLGFSGGIMIAAVASAAGYANYKDKKRWLFGCAISVISVTSAAVIFYLFLNRGTNPAAAPVFDNRSSIALLAAVIALAALIHNLLSGLLKSIFFKVKSELIIPVSAKENLAAAAIRYLIIVGGTILANLSFLKFGVWFGLVVLPVVIAAHLAYRIYVKSLAQKTKQITEANRIHVATVEALATAIDARDQVGVGHVRRTQIFAVGIGEVLHLSAGEIEALRTGALLHDIGKLAVPDHILNKPGRLTPAEMEKMKIHSSVGASILGKINFPYPVVETVEYHHEMWDGTGYPRGLKKEDIPLTARILAIADAYDTLRGARPYRPAVSREESRRLLLNEAGTHFDPKLIDLFLRNLRQFELEIDAQGLSYNLDGEVEEDLFSSSIEPNGIDANQGYVAQIKRANREVFTLYELARVFSSSLNLEETLSLFVKKIGELVPFDSCVIYLLDKTQETARAVHAEGRNAADLKNKQIKTGEGATGYVLKKRQPVYNINPALDFSFYQMDFIQDYTAMASLPLITEENLVGAVSLYSCELENYEDEHMRLLETVSRIAADTIFKSLRHADAESRALTDPMTELPNARSLQSQFETEVARASRNNTQFQILMLDLDGFKAVNDTFGHKTGDLLLKEISKVMRGQLRDYDFLARYAGDEFVIIVPETNEKDIRELCERMEAAVRGFSLPVDDGKIVKVGVSLGAAGYPQHGETLDKVLAAADKAMYAVKANHKRQSKFLSAPPANFVELAEDVFVVELDETHILSSAIN